MLRSVSSRILRTAHQQLFRRLRVVVLGPSTKPVGREITKCSSRFYSDGVKGKLTNLFEQGAKRVSETVQRQSDNALDALEAKARDASTKLSTEAQNAFKKGLVSAEDALRKSSTKMSEAAKSAASRTGQVVSEKSRTAADATSKRIREQGVGMIANAQSIGTKAIRWFSVWALAAIAVYGFATAMPAALIKHIFSGDSRSTNDGDKNEAMPNKSQWNGWSLWNSSNDTVGAQNQHESKRLWPWTSGRD